MKPFRLLIIAFVAVLGLSQARGQIITTRNDSQIINTDSVRRAFDDQPYFGLYKDNYFIFGPSVGPKATKENTNV